MATGLEIVGTLAALYQLINLSVEFITEWKAVGVQKTAKKCRASAQALLGELSFLETEQESNNCMGPVRYVVKSKLHRKKIEKIEARFKNNQQELQIILQSEILSQNKAMQYLEMERFASLEEDIRILIEQGSKGFFGLEAFIEAQHEATNKIVKSRLVATDNLIVQEFSKAQQGIKDSAAEVQRKEFLESFRYPEMNKRYNDILDSSDANFDRVFASYEKVTKHDQRSVLSKDDSSHPSSEASEYDPSHGDFSDIDSDELRAIDKSWSNFINWLKSRDSLFCIQGKPGSGKSTLIKFVIDNENTQRLLEHQSSDIVIMSHFFWKIGSEEQSTIKGFLCSLVHQLLAHSEHLQELAMRLYDTVSHKSYHDWSSKPLKSPLRQVLEAESHAICVFVDGLDEVANDDGLDKLTREIEEILQFPGIKICVSSRPEASVVEWLERLNAPSILLEDLTRPEMSSYVHQGLDPLLSSKKLSMETHRYLCDEMRLAELPSKIHDLYADLWERLNERSPVYRRDAVRFVQYVLTKQGQAIYFRLQEHPAEERFYVRQPVLGQIAFAEMPDRHGGLLKHGDRIDSKELQEACDMQEIK
ncbi:related to small s protein [Fusarium fujikuroi]|nr:related to small s protein [Fusarium fujikuroi]